MAQRLGATAIDGMAFTDHGYGAVVESSYSSITAEGLNPESEYLPGSYGSTELANLFSSYPNREKLRLRDWREFKSSKKTGAFYFDVGRTFFDVSTIQERGTGTMPEFFTKTRRSASTVGNSVNYKRK